MIGAAKDHLKSSKSTRKMALDMTGPAAPSGNQQNFIRANALDAIHTKPGPAEPEQKLYRKKVDYGKVPDYLIIAKRKAQKEKEEAGLSASQCLQEVSV